MDASKRNHSDHDSPFQSHSQDVKVVAAGYSDAVPPNTTVLIYTTNNEGTEQVAISDADAEHVIVENSAFMQGSQVEYRGKENRQEIGSDKIVGASSNPMSEQIVRREAIGIKQMHENPGTTLAVYKAVQEVQGVTKENISSLPHQFPYVLAQSSNSLLTSSCSPTYNKTSSAIPEIRRMVIPNKQISETSPWEVGSVEDAESYDMCAEAVHYEQDRQPSQPGGLKMELTDSSHPPNVTESEFQRHERSFKVSAEENKKQAAVLTQAKVSVGKNRAKSPKPMGLNSYLEGAIANNLPTLEVSQIAETFVDALDQVDADAE